MTQTRSPDEQFEIVLDRAKRGSVEAQFNVGRFYHDGKGTEEDPIEAARWWFKAAQQGHSDAKRRLRTLLREELRFSEQGPGLARWWFGQERADAEAGDAEAQSVVGEMYMRGHGTCPDEIAAVKWWRKAAGQGHSGAKQHLRRLKAKRGDLEAQFALGMELLEKPEDESAQAEGLRWLKRAADRRHLEAMIELALVRLRGPEGMLDSKEGTQLLLDAADRGHDRAIEEIVRLYCLISGPKVSATNGDRAMRWLCQAAEQGQPKAQYRMGRLYLDGKGLPQDPAQAYPWLLKAAASGHDDAQYIVGCMYRCGHGVSRNEGEALKWLYRSEEQGNSHAQRELGLLGGQPGENLPW